MLAELKTLANKRDVPYQSLLKVLLGHAIAADVARFPRQPKYFCLFVAVVSSSRVLGGPASVRISAKGVRFQG